LKDEPSEFIPVGDVSDVGACDPARQRIWPRHRIIGVDEVGRGSLAGPVCAGAYVFHEGAQPPQGLRDSKKTSPTFRASIEPTLLERGTFGYGQASRDEIDAMGIVKATFLAMYRAIDEMRASLPSVDLSDYAIVVDGSILPDLERFGAGYVTTMVRADDSVPSVCAAANIAKLRRDLWMIEAAKSHPAYGFDENMGYGSPSHLAAIAQKGPCVLHRMSFAPMKKKISKHHKV
jgi:ribonuclease HII